MARATTDVEIDAPIGGPSSEPSRVGRDRYAAWRAGTLGALTDQLEQRLVLKLLGDVVGLRVLDAGCGDGVLSLTLAERGGQVTGVDADPEMLAAARARIAGAGMDVAFIQGELGGLPFADDAFDVVVAVTVLCFVPDAEVALAELARVVRPGGRLVIAELGRWSAWAIIRGIRGRLGHTVWRAVRHRTAAELRGLVASAGVTVTDVRGAVYYPPVGWLARLLTRLDPWLGRRTTVGAAFIVVVGTRLMKGG
jgi:2-polyprenyl-3-methyl-5-hydroxy-6-metoxy-1,4-benzoquinol methylase